MARTLTKDEISDLTIGERIDLIETLWNSLEPDQLPLPESHRRVLDESLAEYRRDPGEGRSWDEVRDDLFRTR
ncbi:MAG TPA: addiction module protein [Thermoanaerobaculia bacterium]|nr:addiction module protein [Thermoanaerobaculia bacterium]